MDWETLSPEMQRRFRALAFKVFEAHVVNKIEGFKMAIEVVENVQVAPSTPKSWLRGVQEAKNALVWVLDGFADELETRVDVPDALPDGFDALDPYEHLRAGETAPQEANEGALCGAEHESMWQCTRAPHPSHWQHWDASTDGLQWDEDDEEDAEFVSSLDGIILATWHDDGRLESLHPALGELDGE